MRSPEQLRRVIRHLQDAQVATLRAAAPVPAGIVMEGDRAKAEALRDENRVRAMVIGRTIDALFYALGEPAELEEWVKKWDRMDRVTGRTA